MCRGWTEPAVSSLGGGYESRLWPTRSPDPLEREKTKLKSSRGEMKNQLEIKSSFFSLVGSTCSRRYARSWFTLYSRHNLKLLRALSAWMPHCRNAFVLPQSADESRRLHNQDTHIVGLEALPHLKCYRPPSRLVDSMASCSTRFIDSWLFLLWLVLKENKGENLSESSV